MGANKYLFKYSAAGTLLQQQPINRKIVSLSFDILSRRLWVATDKTLSSHYQTGQIINQVKLTKSTKIEDIDFVNRLGVLWVASKKHLQRYNRDGVLLQTIDLKKPEHISADGTGNIWVVGDEDRLHLYSPDGILQLSIKFDKKTYKHIDDIEDIAINLNDSTLWILAKKILLQVNLAGEILRALPVDKKSKLLVITGDITPPNITIISPVEGALVSRKPDIKLNYEDIGLGVDVRTVALTVDGFDVSVDCIDTPTTAMLSCTPNTELTSFDPVLSLTIKDLAGNLSAAATVTVKLDSDGDGHPDDMDTYPLDPTRFQLAAITGIVASLQEQVVRVEWQPIADQVNLVGYNVYRLSATSDEVTKLNTDLITTINFTDTSVENGTGYRYRVTAIDPKQVEGEQGELVPFFVAYNNTPLVNLQVLRTSIPINLSWDTVDGFRYQIFRTVTNAVPEPLVQVDVNSFTDQGVFWNQAYRYQVATVADFTDVFTNQPIVVLGPRSVAIDVPALPPLGLTLNDVIAAADGVFEILLTGQDRITLSGTYTDALGPVDIQAITGTTIINSTSSNGSLNLVLPVIADAVWAITVTDRGIAPVRDATAQFRMVMDTVSPIVTIEGSTNQNIDADRIVVRGTAIDDRLSVNKITVSSDRFKGQLFGALQSINNSYSAEIPLEAGENVLTVTASDASGNEGQASVTVNRAISPVPELFLLSPENGATVSTPRVSISGVVYSSLPSEQIRITLAGNQLFPTDGATVGTHPFTFNNIPLREGFNRLVISVTTPAGNMQATTTLTLQTVEPPPLEVPPPTLDLGTTGLVTTVSDRNVTISGSARGDGPVTVTINGQEVELTGSNFQQVVDLTALPPGTSDVTVTVTDGQGNSTTQILIYNLDTTPPSILLSSAGIQSAPQVNRVIETPYILEGSVSDTNLAGLTINGQNIGLLPGSNNQNFTFSVPITLPLGVESRFTLEASDLAGNLSSREIIFLAETPLSIEMIEPQDGSEILVSGLNAPIRVVSRTANLPVGASVVAIADGGAAQALILDGTSAVGTVSVSSTDGEHVIIVEVRDENAIVIARARTRFTVVNEDVVDLAVSRFEPGNGEIGVEPNDFITLHFNKPIDPTLLQVDVRETANGMTYLLDQNPGADITELNLIPLTNVSRNQQPVPGGLSLFPGNRMVTFNPSRDIAYDADVYVNVTYAGETLLRTTYKVRPLPTFVQGMLVDTLSRSLSGIDIEIPELDRLTQSDSDGNFTFGFGDSADNTLPSGRYRIVMNPAMRNPRFGAIEEWVNIEKGRLTQVGMTRLPMINPDVPFRRIAGGQPEAILADGNLRLDLSEAGLSFADGRNSGDVHVQFLSLNQLTFSTTSSVIPHWLYGVQPSGIEVGGLMGLRIAMPKLFGSFSYVPPDGTLVALIGFDTRSKQLVPVGVGKIDNNTVTSVKKIAIDSLDYIGYALVETRVQGILQDYVQDKISLNQMITQLERLGR